MTEATTLVTNQLNITQSTVRKNVRKPLVIFRSDHLGFLFSASWWHQGSEIEPNRWFLEMGGRDHHYNPAGALAPIQEPTGCQVFLAPERGDADGNTH